jgi:hypothetical protein
MFKKIRCFYWNMRDRGKGSQVKLFAFVFCLAVISMVGFTGRSLVISHQMSEKVPQKKGVSQGAIEGASTTSQSAISLGLPKENEVTSEVPSGTPVEIKVDTSGMESFLGFMSEEAYAGLERQLITECQQRQCTSVKKLNYQQTQEGSFDVKSFVLLSDGSIYECGYNLKSMAVTVNVTAYTEVDIQNMSEQEKLAEQKAVEKQQKADQKKAKAAKKKKAKEKKTHSKKKNSSKKAKSKKKK